MQWLRLKECGLGSGVGGISGARTHGPKCYIVVKRLHLLDLDSSGVEQTRSEGDRLRWRRATGVAYAAVQATIKAENLAGSEKCRRR